jgi:hypothetical protein
MGGQACRASLISGSTSIFNPVRLAVIALILKIVTKKQPMFTSSIETFYWSRIMKPAMHEVRGCRSLSTLALGLLLSAWSSLLVAAEPLPVPQGRVVLTVTGNLAVTNADNKAEFDMEMLSALPQHEFSTGTPWTDQKHHFRGVLLRDLLRRVGAEGSEVRAVALNDYHYNIERELVAELPLLLATHLDGKPMKIRHKGPVWLMLPLSENPRFNTKRYHELLIWQLKTLDVR